MPSVTPAQHAGRAASTPGFRPIPLDMRLRRAIWALLFGAATTVAVAWLAMFLPPGNAWHGPRADQFLGVWQEPDLPIWQMRRGRSAWHTVIDYWHMQVSGLSEMIPTADYEAQKFDYRMLPRHLRPRSLDELNMSAWYHQTGWPLPALSCSVHWKRQISNADILYTVRGGVQLPRDADFNPRALPLTPVWPGLAVNIAIFASAWLLALWAAGTVRRWRRARRALCPKCGYSRAGLTPGAVCPECGNSPGAAERHQSSGPRHTAASCSTSNAASPPSI